MLKRTMARLGLLVISTDDVERRLASNLIRLWGGSLYQLSAQEGQAELQRKYIEVALATGLPSSISKQVAKRAWRYVRAAQQQPLPVRQSFRLYQ